MKKSALLGASGIGDGLLMMIGAHHFKLAGYRTTVFHDAANDLSLLFNSDAFAHHLPLENLENALSQYDRVMVQNDHSARAFHLFNLREKKNLKNVTFFFPTDSKYRKKEDLLFDPRLPMATNLALACQKMLGTPETKENGLPLPKEKQFRKNPNRIIIHPTSNNPEKNWKQKQFLSLGKKLETQGFFPVFCVSPAERKDWEEIKSISLPYFENLREVKDYIYESGFLIGNDSGLGHLASNLGIPTLTIGQSLKKLRLWRPGWSLGKVVTTPFPLPNFKGRLFRIREKFWQNFVSVSRVYKTFTELKDESCRHMF